MTKCMRPLALENDAKFAELLNEAITNLIKRLEGDVGDYIDMENYIDDNDDWDAFCRGKLPIERLVFYIRTGLDRMFKEYNPIIRNYCLSSKEAWAFGSIVVELVRLITQRNLEYDIIPDYHEIMWGRFTFHLVIADADNKIIRPPGRLYWTYYFDGGSDLTSEAKKFVKKIVKQMGGDIHGGFTTNEG